MAFIDQQTVYPTNKDLAETPGEGDIGLENNVSNNYFRQYQRNSFSNDLAFVLTDPASGLQVLLTGGGEGGAHCMVRGHRFFMSSTLLLKDSGNDVDVVGDIQANSHNHIFISINRDVNLEIDKMQITINTSGVQPSTQGNSLKIGVAVTDGSDVLEIIDQRQCSISLPAYVDFDTLKGSQSTYFGSVDGLVSVPILGQTTNLSLILLAAAAGLPVDSDQDIDVKVVVEGPGPDGLGLQQESVEQTIVTKRAGGATFTQPTLIKTWNRVFINIENEIGRFEGGYLRIGIKAKIPAAGVEFFLAVERLDFVDNFNDSRGLARVQNWNANI